MTLSLFGNGHASIMGLHNTSISPLPTAYTQTQIRIPTIGLLNKDGTKAKPISPIADAISEMMMLLR